MVPQRKLESGFGNWKEFMVLGLEVIICQVLPWAKKFRSRKKILRKKMGMDVRTLQNYKLLSDMIPELEDLMDTGIVTKTTALAMMRNLSEDEQEKI